MTAASEARRAVKRRRIKRLAITDGVLLFAGAVALTVTLAVDNAPSVQADELRQPPEVSEPVTPVAGPVQPIFDFADVTPWDPGKEPHAVTVERPQSTLRDARPSVPRGRPQVTGPVSVVPPAPTTPQKGAEPVKPNDPLTDDGTFGDGCEQPGTRERCDPDSDDPRTDDGEFGDGCEEPGTRERCDPVVGLPPVIVEEPAEEETPVDEVEVVEPVAEVAE